MHWLLFHLIYSALWFAKLLGYQLVTCDAEYNPVSGITVHLWSNKELDTFHE